MSLVWIESGTRAASRSRRYTQTTPMLPVGEWATDELSQVYDRVDEAVHEEQLKVRENIMANSRVDPGFMRSMVESMVSTPGERLVRSLGGWERTAHYTPDLGFEPDDREAIVNVDRR